MAAKVAGSCRVSLFCCQEGMQSEAVMNKESVGQPQFASFSSSLSEVEACWRGEAVKQVRLFCNQSH